MAPTLSPLVRYGGKTRLASRIIALMPPHEVYVEPFAGAASVLFRKARTPREIISDLDGRLVNCLKMMRDHPRLLQIVLEHTPYDRAEFGLCKQRSKDPLEDARRFFVLHRQSVNGLGEHWQRSAGTFRWKPWETWRNKIQQLPAVSARLKGVEIYHAHYHRALANVLIDVDQPGTVIYADPCYVHATRHSDSDYRCEMNDDAHRDLLDVLRAMKHAHVLISGYPSDLYALELKGWRVTRWRVKASAGNHRSDGRGTYRVECVWRNW